MDKNKPIKAEDYAEPCCPLSMEGFGVTAEIKPVPQKRIMDKLDEYMAKRDYAGAERHLNYWQAEAELGSDLRGKLLIMNEKIGFYRKTNQKEKAYESIDLALELLQVLDYEGSITSGTTYTNAATACQNFGDPQQALIYFQRARKVYELSEHTAPDLLGGLYNNMAISLAAVGRYDEAIAMYNKALCEMEKVQGSEPERAITYLNMANVFEEQLGLEEAESTIFDLLDMALDLLENPTCPQDGYFAFVLEKCAPTFSYYGYFKAAEELATRSEAIYARA